MLGVESWRIVRGYAGSTVGRLALSQVVPIIIRIACAAGAISMLLIYGVRWINDFADTREAVSWIDKHPGWVLALVSTAALVALLPQWLWYRLLGIDAQAIAKQRSIFAGVRDHIDLMLNALPKRLTELPPEFHEKHLNSMVTNAGMGIKACHALGAFDEHPDLVNILNGVEAKTHSWQVDDDVGGHWFHGYWYWLSPRSPGHDVRGDYRVYGLQILRDTLNQKSRIRRKLRV